MCLLKKIVTRIFINNKIGCMDVSIFSLYLILSLLHNMFSNTLFVFPNKTCISFVLLEKMIICWSFCPAKSTCVKIQFDGSHHCSKTVIMIWGGGTGKLSTFLSTL